LEKSGLEGEIKWAKNKACVLFVDVGRRLAYILLKNGVVPSDKTSKTLMKNKRKSTLEARAVSACYHLLEHLEGARRQSGVLINELRFVVRAHKRAVEQDARGRGK